MANNNTILEVKHLKQYFKTPRGPLHAVDDVSFTLEKGKTLGVVGESGCGKSTLGRTVIGLLEATAGEVIFKGEKDVTKLTKRELVDMRQHLQIIFQDPYSSLNPRMPIATLIAEPLKIFKRYNDKEALNNRVLELMDTVGLARRLVNSYPHELDGGRRQRIGVARALALNPDVIICDEPVSALDVSIQAQVLNLLEDLQESQGLSYMFITHDLSVVKHISHDIMVMYLGCAVEKAESSELFKNQLHPYTKGLLSAIPIPDIDHKKERVVLQGEISSPINPGNKCRFVSRCNFACDRCRNEQPQLEEVLPNHFVACHKVREINGL